MQEFKVITNTNLGVFVQLVNAAIQDGWSPGTAFHDGIQYCIPVFASPWISGDSKDAFLETIKKPDVSKRVTSRRAKP